MEKSKGTALWVLFIFIIITLQFAVPVIGEQSDDDQDESPSHPPISEVIAKMLSIMNGSHQSYWERIKAVSGYLQEQFLPPPLKGMDETEDRGETAGKIKGSVTESVVDAKEAVKESIGEKDESDAEL